VLTEHPEVPAGPGKFMCDECEVAYNVRKSLKQHNREAHPMRPVVDGANFSCEVCSSPYASRAELLRHLAVVHSITTWKSKEIVLCGHCPAGFVSDRVRRRHGKWCPREICEEARSIPEEIVPVPGRPVPGAAGQDEMAARPLPIAPAVVGWTRIQPKALEVNSEIARAGPRGNLRDSSELVPMSKRHESCPYCDREFLHLPSLKFHIGKEHVNECKDEPTHVCTICEVGYSNVTELRQHHRMLHRSYSEGKCPHCPSVFERLNTLLHHLLVCHGLSAWEGGTIHVCPRCPSGYTSHRALINHLRYVHRYRWRRRDGRTLLQGRAQTGGLRPQRRRDRRRRSVLEPKWLTRARLRRRALKSLTAIDPELYREYTRMVRTPRPSAIPVVCSRSTDVGAPIVPKAQGTVEQVEHILNRTIDLLRYQWLATCSRNIFRREPGPVESPTSAIRFSYNTTAPIQGFVNDFFILCEHAVKEVGAEIRRGTANLHQYCANSALSKGKQPSFVLLLPSLTALGKLIRLNRQEQILSIARVNLSFRTGYRALACTAVHVKKRRFGMGAVDRCIIFPDIQPITRTPSPSLCIHLPVGDWVDGNWGTDFEICESASRVTCAHREDDPTEIERCTSAFIIDWTSQTGIEGMGSIRIIYPRTVVRGESVPNLFDDIIDYLKKHAHIY